jgi:hypothetical protein
MRAPLVGTSGGVASDHWVLPAGRTNSCQNRFGPDAAPIGTAAQDVPWAVSAVVSDIAAGAGAGAAEAAGPLPA